MTSNKNIFNISYPIFLTLIAQNIINVTDTAFLGRVSEVALGASAIGGVLYIVIYMLGFGFSQGAQILIGRRNGEQNFAQIGIVFNNALLFNLLFAGVIFLVSSTAVPSLIKLVVSSENVYGEAVEYLDWRIYGFFFSFPNVIFRAFYVGITKTRILTVSAIITATTNVVFDYLLIFGNFGCPEMGIAGAGLASILAEASTFAYLLFYTLTRIDVKKYGLFKFRNTNLQTTRRILDLSIFTMFQYFISLGTWFVFFIFIEHMGERPLAVTNIGRSLYALLMMPGAALATTTNTLISNLIGAGEKEKVLSFIHKMMRIVFLLVLPLMTFTLVFPHLFAGIYTNDSTLIDACVPVLRVVSIAMICCAVSNILFNAVSGTGNTRTAFLIEMITLFFYMVYIYYTAIVVQYSLSVVWFSEFIYWGLIGIFAYFYMRNGKWKKKEI